MQAGREYDEAVHRVHRAFCDPAHELVGEWDREMADALRRNGYRIVRDYAKDRHFYEGDGEQDCTVCGETQDADFERVSVHFHDGDG